MLSKVVVSDKFIMGQNPFSTTKSAEAVVRSLGLTLVSRTPYKDEKNIYFIEKLFEDTSIALEWAKNELKQNNLAYDLPLLAVYGYYKIQAAKENKSEILDGIALIELTSPYYFNENLQYFLAKTFIKLDQKEKTKGILNGLIAANKLKKHATKLLNERESN